MLKVLELFSGTGCQVQALKNIGIECVSTQCEIDKYAVNTYNQLHGETPNLGDISKVNPDNLQQGQWDLITYSFPCQSISIAGKQAGLAKNSGTTSSLLWECEKIIKKVKPKYLLMENVANLLSDKFKPFFYSWLKTLEEMGYCNYYDVLNAKDFGIPQNRSRLFCVSILGKHVPYVFPQKQPLKLRLKDMLEDRPDEKYYIKKEISDKFKFNLKNKEFSNSIRVGGKDSTDQKHSWNLVADKDNTEIQQIIEPMIGLKISPTIRAARPSTIGYETNNNEQIPQTHSFRIRKLTERECWRLQGWKDEQFDKIKGISRSQLYKMAGNGIVINVLEAIFANMFLRKPTKEEEKFVVDKPMVQLELL